MRILPPDLTGRLFRGTSGGLAFGAAAALIAGEAAAFAMPEFASVWPWVVFVLALMILAAYGWNLRRGGLLLVFVLGAVLAARCDARLAAALGPVGPGPSCPRTCSLVVGRDVSVRPAGRSKPAGFRYAGFTSRVDGLDVHAVVLVPAGEDPPRPGETWRCTGWLGQVKKGRSRFASRRFWAARPGAAVRESAADAPAARLQALSDDLARRAGIGLEAKPETAALNRAILLGRRADLPRERRRTFVDAGTVHVFAISGLHVMLVAGLLAMAAAGFGLSFRLRGLVVIPLIVGYTVLTGGRPSAVRAAVMAAFYFAAPVLGRRPDALASWSLTALVVYGLNPERCFDVGCALSFVVMLGIVVWVRWARRLPPMLAGLDRAIRVARADEPSPRPPVVRKGRERGSAFRRLAARGRWLVMAVLPERLVDSVQGLWRHPGPARLVLLRNTLVWLAGTFAVSLAAWTAGVPVAAHVFGRFTPCGLLANLVVIPAATVVVLSGMLGLLASYACTPLAAVFNCVAGLGTDLMTAASSAAAAIPGGHFDVVPWTMAECAGWYGMVALVLFVLDRLLVRRKDGLDWTGATGREAG